MGDKLPRATGSGTVANPVVRTPCTTMLRRSAGALQKRGGLTPRVENGLFLKVNYFYSAGVFTLFKWFL